MQYQIFIVETKRRDFSGRLNLYLMQSPYYGYQHTKAVTVQGTPLEKLLKVISLYNSLYQNRH